MARHGLRHKQLRMVGGDDCRALQGEVGSRASVQGAETDPAAPGLLRRERERGQVADLGCASGASHVAVPQVQGEGKVQLHALRRIRPCGRLAQEGPHVRSKGLWDSTGRKSG